LTLLLGSCGGGSDAPLAQTPAQDSIAASYGITLDNLQIAEALYRDSARTPAGFLADPLPAGQAFVATRHLRAGDIGATPAGNFELCTDDWNLALQWSETAAQATGAATLVGNLTDSRYYEFQRMVGGQPAIYQRTRIYRCAYLDRSTSTVDAGAGAAGTLNLRPVQATALRDLSEYLWRFTGYNNYGNAVLGSSSDSMASGPRHTLVIASLVTNGTGSGCDRIDVLAWRHSAVGASGELTRSVEPLWSFPVRASAGAAVSCAP
jgi:hypothetical protein